MPVTGESQCRRTGWSGTIQSINGRLVVIRTTAIVPGAYRTPGEPWCFATQLKYVKQKSIPWITGDGH